MSVTRLLFLTHRYLGIALGLLMLMWFISGIVMLYMPYPELAAADRLKALPPIAADNCCTLTGDAFPGDGAEIRSFQVEMVGTTPVLLLQESTGRRRQIALSDGAARMGASEAEAQAIAEDFARAHALDAVPRLTGRREWDQWTVGRARDMRPYYHFALEGDDGNELYVSQATSQMVVATDRSQRFWNWFGAVPHWLYFSQLRNNPPLWSQIVIWTSLIGSALTVLGIYIGIRQVKRRRSDGSLASPYRGWWYWHHVPGLIFGLFTLTWAFSGMLSMTPFGWFEGTDPTPAMTRAQGEPQRWEDIRNILPTLMQRLPEGTVSLQSAPWDGRIHALATTYDGRRARLDTSGTPVSLTDAEYDAAAVRIGGPGTTWQLLQEEDAYYYGRAGAPPPLPALRIVTQGDDAARFYLDPLSGRLLRYVDSDAALHRWLFNGLHSLDFTAGFRWRPFWDVLMLVLLLGGVVVTGTGTWLGIRRLAGRSRGQGFLVDGDAQPSNSRPSVAGTDRV